MVYPDLFHVCSVKKINKSKRNNNKYLKIKLEKREKSLVNILV